MITTQDDIAGAKLPSKQQVLSYFLHCHLKQKETVRFAATRTVEKVQEFWDKARIPVRHKQDMTKKVEKLFTEWTALKKNAKRRSATQQNKEDTFISDYNDIFDVAHEKAMEMIQVADDREFLLAQREKGRRGCMTSVDTITQKQEKYREERDLKMQRFKRKSELDVAMMKEKVTLGDSSSSEDEAGDTGEPAAGCSSDPPSCPKRGRKTVISKELAATLDRHCVSDRAAMMVVAETAKSLGHDVKELALNRSSIRLQRRQLREQEAQSVKSNFSVNVPLTVHWDGKLLADLTGTEKVDRLPVLVSGEGVSQLLAVPKIPKGTGEAQAHAVAEVLKQWEITNQVRGMCFDTTSSNTGRLTGACVMLEQKLGHELLHFACRHHVMELIAAAAFLKCMGLASGPEIQLFKRFKSQWASMDKTDYQNAYTDKYTEPYVREFKEDLKTFISSQLMTSHPRDDYRELLQLVSIYLGDPPQQGVKFMAPGAMHQARWMAKVIYTFKVWMFRGQFRLTLREEKGLRDLCLFFAKIYMKAWFQCPIAACAPRNDLCLMQDLQKYSEINKDISDVTSQKMSRHLWYLAEVLVGLAVFDENVTDETKHMMVNAMKTHDGDDEPTNKASVDVRRINEMTLPDFMSKNTLKFFSALDISVKFLETPPSSWKNQDDFQAAAKKVKSLSVVNDHAERGVALVQDFSGRLTKDEEQLQFLLQVVAEHRKRFPDALKRTFVT